MSVRRQIWALGIPDPWEPWAPAMDVYRAREGWILKFDLAGVQLQDVTVSVHGRRVSMSGFRRDSILEEGCSYYSMEISYNRFERAIEMPCDVDGAQVSLEARDGILLVRLITRGGKNG